MRPPVVPSTSKCRSAMLILIALMLSGAGDVSSQGVFQASNPALCQRLGNAGADGSQAASLSASLSASTDFPHPISAIAIPSVLLLAGTTPFYSDWALRQKLLVREEVQLFRRNRLSHRPLPFDNVIQYSPLAAVHVLSLAGVPSRHSSWALVRRTVGSMAIATLIVQPVKLAVDEGRPTDISNNSFPSGHTAMAFCGAEMLRLEYSDVSPLIPVAGYIVASFTGVMRIYNDRHWLNDVLAGAAIGIASADLSWIVNKWVDNLLTPNK